MITSSALRTPRRVYIDWLRGLAVLFMILWHVVDAWHLPGGRDTGAFAVVVFCAGWAAPTFLFLAGVSLPMAGLAHLSRGRDRTAASLALASRGWMILLLAHLFRFQSFVLSPGAAWNGLLKPDILNVLGLGLVLTAVAWGRATSTHARVWWLLVPALIVAFVLTPWAHDWWWPSMLHPRLEGYIRIAGGNAVFSLFPALAYVFGGAFVGSLLAETNDDGETRFLQRCASVGAVMLGATLGLRFVQVPAGVQDWIGPAVIVVLRIGVLLMALAVVRTAMAMRRGVPGRPGPMVQLGRASLIVYWVHVELAYGNVSYPLHKALSLPWALLGFAAMTAAMTVVSRWWLNRPSGAPWVPSHMVACPAVRTRRSSHDIP